MNGRKMVIKVKAEIENPVKIAKDWRLSGESVRVFVLLYDHKDVAFSSMAELSAALGISTSTLYRALAGLRKLGYVEEKRDGHGRILVLKEGRMEAANGTF